MLNCIVWNLTICIKIDFALNNLQRLICHKTQPTNQPAQKDLAINNPQELICFKIQPNQIIYLIYIYVCVCVYVDLALNNLQVLSIDAAPEVIHCEQK